MGFVRCLNFVGASLVGCLSLVFLFERYTYVLHDAQLLKALGAFRIVSFHHSDLMNEFVNNFTHHFEFLYGSVGHLWTSFVKLDDPIRLPYYEIHLLPKTAAREALLGARRN